MWTITLSSPLLCVYTSGFDSSLKYTLTNPTAFCSALHSPSLAAFSQFVRCDFAAADIVFHRVILGPKLAASSPRSKCVNHRQQSGLDFRTHWPLFLFNNHQFYKAQMFGMKAGIMSLVQMTFPER